MDKRREENLRVKENIINTLFRFMQKKSLSDITVTELVKGAGVARASFYRNYDSKEDVLVTLIRDVLELFRNEMKEDTAGLYSYDNVVLSFSYFRKYRKYILDLYHSGFAMAILEEINHFHESVEGTMPSSSIENTNYICILERFSTRQSYGCLKKILLMPRILHHSSFEK